MACLRLTARMARILWQSRGKRRFALAGRAGWRPAVQDLFLSLSPLSLASFWRHYGPILYR